MSRRQDSHSVSLFDDDPGRKPRPLPPGGIYTRLVGVSKVDPEQKRLQKVRRLGIAYLVVDREPDNRFDPNAIRLLLPGCGPQEERAVGYLDKEMAASLAPVVDARASLMRCRVEMVTGGEHGKSYGVNVALYYDDGFDLLPFHPRYTVPKPKLPTSRSGAHSQQAHTKSRYAFCNGCTQPCQFDPGNYDPTIPRIHLLARSRREELWIAMSGHWSFVDGYKLLARVMRAAPAGAAVVHLHPSWPMAGCSLDDFGLYIDIKNEGILLMDVYDSTLDDDRQFECSRTTTREEIVTTGLTALLQGDPRPCFRELTRLAQLQTADQEADDSSPHV